MKHAPLPVRILSFVSAAAVIAAVSLPPDGLACGYHSNVVLDRVGLDVVYPDAVHVMSAISTAQIEKRLRMHVSSAAATPDLFAYHRTVKALERLGRQLVPDPAPLSFSLVLIEQMLWTRFDIDGGVKMQIHVSAPQPGDLVVVSGEDVISEIIDARMSVDNARKLGLIRLYGSDAQIAQFLAAFRSGGTRTSLTAIDG